MTDKEFTNYCESIEKTLRRQQKRLYREAEEVIAKMEAKPLPRNKTINKEDNMTVDEIEAEIKRLKREKIRVGGLTLYKCQHCAKQTQIKSLIAFIPEYYVKPFS